MTDMDRQILTCLQDEEAFCTAACPFHLKTRDFIEKIRRGSFDAAYKAYRNAVGFPEIVAALCSKPCEAVCPYHKTNAAIDLLALERAAVAYAKNKKPTDYNIPVKNKKIAVVGAGISGLACALRMAEKRYELTVFEQTGKIGGSLWQMLPSGVFGEEIERQFMYVDYELKLNTKINSLAELKAFDAVYIATGQNGDDFGLAKQPQNGFWLGGSVLGVDKMTAIAQGLAAVNPIEWWLKTGAMKSFAGFHATGMQVDEAAWPQTEPVPVPASGLFSREEAMAEAKRCTGCTCEFCHRACDLLAIYKLQPKRFKDQIDGTVYPKNVDGQGHTVNRLIYSCNHCGHCREACPESIDFDEFILQSKRIMQKKGSLPWAFSAYWLRDFAQATGESASLCQMPPNLSKAERVYFPGCQLGASEPRYVKASYGYLLAENQATALMLNCCGAPLHWAGKEAEHQEFIARLKAEWTSLGKPKMIFACPTCRKTFAEFLPEIPAEFIYERPGLKKLAAGLSATATVSVFDPCVSRYFPPVQAAVRALLIAAGYKLQPLAEEKDKAKCCSWGGHVAIANPDYADKVTKRRIEQSDRPFITYCSNCRDIFAKAGKPARHIFDILFNLNDDGRKPPLVTERQLNRENLQKNLLKTFWQIEKTAAVQAQITDFNLRIPDGLRQKLSDAYILEPDIVQTVQHCEATKQKLLDPETGHFKGHLRVGNFTYWVEYAVVQGGFKLIDAYGHRMQIDGD